MKLFAKTSLYYLTAGIPVLLIAGFVCYWMISTEVKERNNEHLDKRKLHIENLLLQNDTGALNLILQAGEATVEKILHNPIVQVIYSDTLIYDIVEDESNLNHLLTSVVKASNGNYSVRVWLKTLEADEFMTGIFTSLFVILFLLFLVFFLINWWVSHTVWKPFYKTVETLQSFSASDKVKPVLHESPVREFHELNNSVNRMMDKMMSDFKSQKQFTENASHEMQTPLAVIKSKIDLLIQSDKLGERENDLISGIDAAAAKLERLNKSLLLLTKIENKQFGVFENVSVLKIIDESLGLFEEHLQAKRIVVTKNIYADAHLTINADICSILISNILQNSIRHNIKSGSVEITLNEKQLLVSNSGTQQPLDETKLFKRFQKNSSSPESLGLGLAIAKEIAEANGFILTYSYEWNKHTFSLMF